MDSPALQAIASAGRAARKGAPRVLSITGDAARRNALHELIHGLAPDAHVESDADAIDGLMSAWRMPADLVLVDAALPHDVAGALARQLACFAPQATVIVLDASGAARTPDDALHWSDVVPACRRWLAQWQAPDDGDGAGSEALAACSAANAP